jgi:hypothetical protein
MASSSFRQRRSPPRGTSSTSALNGRDNVGIGPDLARDRAAAAGIDINAVVLKQEEDLVPYFWDHVRTGADSFVIDARELPDSPKPCCASS